MSISEIWNKFWKDSKGRVVIWQKPNGWLIGWVVLTCLSLLTSGKTADLFAIAGELSLIIWALLEIFKGVNGLRRLLGFLVLIFAVSTFIKNI